MKKNIFKTTIIVTLLGISGSISNAQWAVTNVNDAVYYPLYFAPTTGLFTRAVGLMISGLKGSVDSVKSTQDIMIKQQDNMEYAQDLRSRMALGQADIARRDFEQLPTLKQCIEMSKNQTAGASVSAAMGGAGSGGNARAGTQVNRERNIKDVATAQAAILENKAALGTCSTVDASAGIGGCGGPGPLAGADTKIHGLLSNVEGARAGMDFANFSMGANAYTAALKNANDSTMYAAPGLPDPAQLRMNPAYKAAYDTVMNKLSAARDALIEQAKVTRGGTPPAGSMAEKVWSDSRAQYQQMFPTLVYPNNPSLFEMLNFAVHKEYIGVNPEVKDPVELAIKLNQQVAVSNMIAWQSYKQQQLQTILLGHLLTQQTTPANLQAVNAELAKTKNMR